jgi:mevalonate kinase
VIISTPAKVILSGEHSVVYGAPAIGAPLSLFLYSRWTETPDDARIVLNYKSACTEIVSSWAALPPLLAKYRARFASFKKGEAGVGSILPQPHDLVTLIFATFHERFCPETGGISLAIDTEIPISSGLGSSSSLILNLLQGLLRLSHNELPKNELLDMAKDIEDFQHGTSSGLDLALVSADQPLVYIKGQGIVRPMPPVASGIVLVNSGKPIVSTGQCVAEVRRRFADDKALWKDFAACTLQIETACIVQDNRAMKDGVAENQKLLERIGVVPEKVKMFINRCFDHGIAAKICGAGAVSGDTAGMIWALADDDDTMQSLQDIAQSFGYSHGLYSVPR